MTEAKHCCEDLERALTLNCDQHEDSFDCPDVLIFNSEKFDEYGIIIKDGGRSVSSIQYCPYCGTKLPASKRDDWFDMLEKLGFDNPLDQDIPEEFLSGAWYKKSGP
jgi:hypothetical protein